MTTKQLLEATAPLAEQSERDTDVAAAAPDLGECVVCLLPLEDHFLGPHCSSTHIGCRGARTASTLLDRHLAKALGFGLTQFYKRKKRQEFRRFELSPQLPDSNTRYSGALVQRWLDGERLDETAVPAALVERRRPGRPRLVRIHARESDAVGAGRLRDGETR